MLTLNNLVVGREGAFHLQPLSCSLLPGACVVLHGANGSGKSTTLRTLATLMKPSNGHIEYNNTNIRESIDEYRSLLCYISDIQTVDPELSVLENLLTWAMIASREIAMSAALVGMGLTEVVDEPVYTLSKGMQRRVQLARLLLSNAIIWLLDEPFVHLDDNSAAYLANMIKLKCSSGGIVILSSHHALERLPEAAIIKLEGLYYG